MAFDRPIWSGIYDNFNNITGEKSTYDEDNLIEKSVSKLEILKEAYSKKKTIPEICCYDAYLLPLVAATTYTKKQKVTILDFGGGMGMSYYPVKACLPNSNNLFFHILEFKRICDAGSSFFNDDPHIFFHTELPLNISKIDILHFGSSIHYIENWQDTIVQLLSHQPENILFSDLTAGDIQTYATIQNFYERQIPVWFFNINEIVDFFNRHNYQLIFKATYKSKILGEIQPYPQDNFPLSHQLGFPCTVLFQKIENQC